MFGIHLIVIYSRTAMKIIEHLGWDQDILDHKWLDYVQSFDMTPKDPGKRTSWSSWHQDILKIQVSLSRHQQWKSSYVLGNSEDPMIRSEDILDIFGSRPSEVQMTMSRSLCQSLDLPGIGWCDLVCRLEILKLEPGSPDDHWTNIFWISGHHILRAEALTADIVNILKPVPQLQSSALGDLF